MKLEHTKIKKEYRWQNNLYFKYWKKGHFAGDGRSKLVEGDMPTCGDNNESDGERDFYALCTNVKIDLSEEESTLITERDKLINYSEDWITDSGCSNHTSDDVEILLTVALYNEG